MKQEMMKFQFFNTDATKIDVTPIDACFVQGKVLLQTKNLIHIFDNQIVGSISAHTEIMFMRASNQQKDIILITFGVDCENGQRVQSVKLWSDIESNTKYKRQIIVTKQGIFNCFAVAKDLTAMAFGLSDGSILTYRSRNLLTQDYKDSSFSADADPIRSVHIARVESSLNLYCTTDSNVICFQNMQNRKRFNVPGGQVFTLSQKGTLLGALKDDYQQIVEFDDFKKLNQYALEGQKFAMKSFKQYLLISILPKKEDKEIFLYIYDMVNNYVAYNMKHADMITFVPGTEFAYVITPKSVVKLTERENTHKIEKFFQGSYFDLMNRFAANQNCDKSLLAEISKLHGDYLYDNHDFQAAIKEYMKTAGNLEPSYVISKFLDVSQVDYLIQYISYLYQVKLADKNHIALLLNCFLKMKQIHRLEEFLKEISSDLFDIDTAIKECRASQLSDLALKLAEARSEYEYYLLILIEDKTDAASAIQYIREKIPLDEKGHYLKKFGLQLLKLEPQVTLEFLKQYVQLALIAHKKKPEANKGIEVYKLLNPEESKLCQQFSLSNEMIERLPMTTFGKFDELLQLFMSNDENLEQFLIFMIENTTEKNMIHRYFEYHLEKYQDAYKNNQQKDPELAAKETKMLVYLDDDKRYDKNHLLVMFKMYNFAPGVICLLKKLELREELLNYYEHLNANAEIIELCKEYGSKETSLWIHALKYFTKQNSQSAINDVLLSIAELEYLSPSLILSILSKNQNVNFKLVKQYFIEKIKKDRNSVEQDQIQVRQKLKQVQETREKYRQLKSSATIFQPTKCTACDNPLTLPSFFFLCGHTFHENCTLIEHQIRKCTACLEYQVKLQKRKDLLNEASDFDEELVKTKDKFDVICRYLSN